MADAPLLEAIFPAADSGDQVTRSGPTDGRLSKRISASLAGPLRALLEQTIARWHNGEAPNALAALAAHPLLAQSPTAALELACEEFYLRRARGERLTASRFCARFPDMRRSLEMQLAADEWVEQQLGGLPPVPWPQAGDSFLHYQIEEILGRGGSSCVYLCRARLMGDRQEVVKVSRRCGAYESQIAGALSHRRIVPVLAAAKDPHGRLVLSMPFLARTTLCRIIDLVEPASPGAAARHPSGRRVLDVLKSQNADAPAESDPAAERTQAAWALGYIPGVLALAIEIAEGLQFAHRRQVLHLDLKPNNVLVGADGQAWLFDFDLALDRKRPGHGLGGTPPYMAPEHLELCFLQGDDAHPEGAAALDSPLDERSDIFSVGVLLYELFTGRLPFLDCPAGEWSAASASELAVAIRAGRRRDIPLAVDREIAALIDDCLAYDPARRPASTDELLRRLAPLLVRQENRRPQAQRRRFLFGAVTAAGAVAAGLTWRALDWRGLSWGLAPSAESRLNRAQSLLQSGHPRAAIEQAMLGLPLAQGDRRLQAKLLAVSARARQRAALQGLAQRPEPGTREIRAADTGAEAARRDLEGAIADLKQANRLVPGPQSLALAGYYFNLLDKPGSAILSYQQARPDWRSARLLHNLGYSYSRLPDLVQAKQSLAEAVTLDPSLEPAWRRLAFVELASARLRSEFPGEARRCIDRALALGPLTGELLLLAGEILLEAGRHEPSYYQLAEQRLVQAARHGAGRQAKALLQAQLPPRYSSLDHGRLAMNNASGGGRFAAVAFVDPLPGFFPAEFAAPEE